MDIKLDDNDITDFILNIKVKFPNTTKTLKINEHINYNLLYDSLVVFPDDLINVIHEYTSDQYVIKYTLDNDYNDHLQVIKIGFIDITNNNNTYKIG